MRLNRVIVVIAAIALTTAACGDAPDATSSVQPEAPRTLQQRAEQGDTAAQVEFAASLQAPGKSLLERREGCRWFQRAADSRNVHGVIGVAKCLEAGLVAGDADLQRGLWNRAAEMGDAEAQYRRATYLVLVDRDGVQLVTSGMKVEQRFEQFDHWIRKSADQGYSPAKHALAMAYLVGVRRLFDTDAPSMIQLDRKRGAELLLASADGGHWEAQWAAAVLFDFGFGEIDRDPQLAAKYWDLLEKQAAPEALLGIGQLYDEGSEQDYRSGRNKYRGKSLSFEESNELALRWYEKGAAQNDSASMYWLGRMYLDGRGAFKSDQKAFNTFLRAAEAEDFRAMWEVAKMLGEGQGTVRDYQESFRWLERASRAPDNGRYSDVQKARHALGRFFERGLGTIADPVLAYAWFNVVAASGVEGALKDLERVEKELNAEQLAEAQQVSRGWTPGELMSRVTGPQRDGIAESAKSGELSNVASGTGFFVAVDGLVLTNSHVVEGCKEIRVPAHEASATIVVSDTMNDLALLKSTHRASSPLKFAKSSELRQGDAIYVFGFPLDGYLPASGNITPGIVSALAGPGNSASIIQVTAPVQPGNSGGPVLDDRGRVVGVVVGKADAIRLAKATGDIPQNVNFAISGHVVRAFLEGNRVPFESAGIFPVFAESAASIANIARSATIKLECWR